MTKKIVIVGCGWLGQQIAPALAVDWQVFGTRRSASAAQSLAAPVHGVVLPLDNTELSPALQAVFADAWVICTIPPGGRTGGAATDYLPVLKTLAALCQQAGIKGGIHISSTGVYQGLSGEVDETAALKLETPRVALLAAGEQLLRDTGQWLTLRLAGLMGPGRHPGRFVAGKTLSGASHPVNMIHSADVAQALSAIISHWPLPRRCYNLSSPLRVSKQDFYQAAFAQLGNPEQVSFAADTTELPRQVLARALEQDTNFRYQFADARLALPNCGQA